jgi:hypothetical protein
MTIDLATYERALAPARARMAEGRWAREILAPDVSPDTLELFLIQFCSLGVAMTEPVEGWIHRAGARCTAIGLPELGRALRRHARHEAGHEQMMIRDTHALVERRKREGHAVPSAEALIARPPTPGIARYVRLHEETIAGPAPFAQIAIEHEIERLSTTHGAAFVRRCVETLGPDIRACLSFVEDHVALDVGHTKFNAAQLGRLLGEHPEFLDALVAAGSAALDAYAAFFEDCIDLAAPCGRAAA